MRSSLVLLAALFIAGCSSSDDAGQQSSTTEAPTADAVLARSAEAMSAIDTVAFDIERSGAAVAIDDAGVVLFESATGHYSAPASADAVVTVEVGGMRAEVAAIAIDGSTWITNPLTGAWEAAPDAFSFDPALLFDRDEGWASLLADGISDAELVEPVPDEDGRFLVRGTVPAERIAVLTGGLANQETELDVWIDVDTSRVAAARFDVAGPDGVTTWDLQLDEYGAEVTITPPEIGGEG